MDAGLSTGFPGLVSIGAQLAILAGAAFAGGRFLPTLASKAVAGRARNARLGEYLPFAQLLRSGTIIRCYDGSLVSVLAIEGLSVSSMTREQRQAFVGMREQWVNSFAGSRCRVRFISRKRFSPMPEVLVDEHDLRREMMSAWESQFSRAYETRHFVVLTVKGQTEKAVELLSDMIAETEQTFQKCRPRLLGTGIGVDATSELLQFWAELIDPTQMGPCRAFTKDLSDRIYACRLEIDNHTGLFRHSSGDGTDRYSYIVAVPVWPEIAQEEIIRRVLGVPAELTILHRFDVMSDAFALLKFEDAEKQILGKGGISDTVENQFYLAKQMLQKGSEDHQSFATYQMIAQIYGDSPEEAARGRNQVMQRLRDMHVRVQVETSIPTALYFTHFPTYDDLTRGVDMPSRSVAQFLTADTQPVGMDRCDWGESPWMIFRTETRSPYRFAPHNAEISEAPGHMLVSGETGSGKSVLLAMLATGCLRFPHARVFILDRDQSFLTWVLGMGGEYFAVLTEMPGVPKISLQPFQLTPSPENRAHQLKLLKMMSRLDDSAAESAFDKALVSVGPLPAIERTLERIVLQATSHDPRIGNAIRPWLPGGAYGSIFDSEIDRVPMSNRITGFDLTRLPGNPDITAPVMTDIFHRIEMTLEGDRISRGATEPTPAFVIFEESSSYLQDPTFRRGYIDLLERGRKKRLVVATIAQRANAFANISADLDEAVRTQSPTRIYFRNLKSGEADFRNHDLNPSDLHFIQGSAIRHLRYACLVKKQLSEGNESVVLDLDDQAFGDYAGLLRSGGRYASKMRELIATQPHDPVTAYLDWFGTVRQRGG